MNPDKLLHIALSAVVLILAIVGVTCGMIVIASQNPATKQIGYILTLTGIIIGVVGLIKIQNELDKEDI